jgi:hypothetical protein
MRSESITDIAKIGIAHWRHRNRTRVRRASSHAGRHGDDDTNRAGRHGVLAMAGRVAIERAQEENDRE